jgi:hypothetical protein
MALDCRLPLPDELEGGVDGQLIPANFAFLATFA